MGWKSWSSVTCTRVSLLEKTISARGDLKRYTTSKKIDVYIDFTVTRDMQVCKKQKVYRKPVACNLFLQRCKDGQGCGKHTNDQTDDICDRRKTIFGSFIGDG